MFDVSNRIMFIEHNISLVVNCLPVLIVNITQSCFYHKMVGFSAAVMALLTLHHSQTPLSKSLRLTWQGSNGGASCGRGPPRRPSSSRWLRRTPSSAASAAAFPRTFWVCGGDTRPPGAGSCGSSGGETTPASQSWSTMSSQVGSCSKWVFCICSSFFVPWLHPQGLFAAL